ncbi:ATP-dependent metallopeptidase FtsH/Yme1/Tma family protein [Egicoccus sp. AB-alg2]|uniref:ATP-dependent metallopeptidase FtsH/Yme1/Tma family protein n=1 Tax=Egicoccus sp. AB-alg2 TaxID=3242693 RepID=UPI00359CBEEA
MVSLLASLTANRELPVSKSRRPDPSNSTTAPRRRSVRRPSSPGSDVWRDKRVWVAATGLVVMIAALVALSWPTTAAEPQRVVLSEAIERVRGGEVAFATIDDKSREVLLVLGDPATATSPAIAPDGAFELPEGEQLVAAYNEGYGPDLAAIFVDAGVPFTGEPEPEPDRLTPIVTNLLPALLIVSFLLWFVARKGGFGQFGKSNRGPAAVPSTRFSDVAGADEAVAELREVVDLLHDPERFAASGATVPRGFLLEGPPGTGKTLLARAVAGEAGVPFFSLSGSEFVEMFVGVGASRVRDVFAKARKHERAIIFIDEIDAIGKARGNGPSSGANDEREATLNQLLVEMDGFEGSGIITLAATNRADVLDQALLRAGRFDRRIAVPAPDRVGRTKILELHTDGRRLADDVDLVALARRTPGMTGADLAALVNSATLEAARDGAEAVNADHLEAALSTAMLGRERRSAVTTDRDRTITAWHEAGHTLAALLQPDADDPVTVTIVPRGPAGGVTWMSGNDNAFMTASEARAKLVTAMAGRAAEERLLAGSFTQGAAGDFQHATELATNMVTRYGMSPLGVASLSPEQVVNGPLAEQVHAAVNTLLDEALAEARALLQTNADLLAAVADGLLLDETLHLADILRLQGELAEVTRA